MITARLDPSNNITVFNSIFAMIITIDVNGGALYVENTNSIAIIDYCTFHTCSSTLSGGGIYMNIKRSILRCLCMLFCHSDRSYPSIYSKVLDSKDNTFIYSSIINSTTSSSYAISIRNGFQVVSHINSSLNYAIGRTAGIMIFYPKGSSYSAF